MTVDPPAGAGGVNFDIATADNTATAGSDYVLRALTNQTIPEGNTTYTFDVTVNGDKRSSRTKRSSSISPTSPARRSATVRGWARSRTTTSAPNLTINNVSLDEGNAGTTTFTFTVSLSRSGAGRRRDVRHRHRRRHRPAAARATMRRSRSPARPSLPASTTYTFDVAGQRRHDRRDQRDVLRQRHQRRPAPPSRDGQGQGTIPNDDLALRSSTTSRATAPRRRSPARR